MGYGDEGGTTERWIEIASVDPWSALRVGGVLYGGMGVLLGVTMLFVSLVARMPTPEIGFAIVAPFLYGIAGAITGGLSALMYNVAAAAVGGIRIERF